MIRLLSVCWVGQEVMSVNELLICMFYTSIWLTQQSGCILNAPDPPLRQIPQAGWIRRTPSAAARGQPSQVAPVLS